VREDPAAPRANRTLALLGLSSVALCAAFALRYPLSTSLSNPRAGWADLVPATGASLALHLGLYLGLTVLQLLALRVLLRAPGLTKVRLAILLATWLLCSAVLMTAAASGESHDIFDYVFRGRMMAESGANPLTETPGEFHQVHRAPFFRYVAWYDHVDAYGPLWEGVSAGVATATRAALIAADAWAPGQDCPRSVHACGNLIAYLTAYRLFAVALTGASAALIASMVRRSRPQWTAAALAAWLWSPVLLVSSAVGAHNDALMIALLLLSLWLLQRRTWLLALLVLALAAHVKLTALIAAPAMGLWLVRQVGWRRGLALIAAGAGIAAGLSFLLYAPFGGWASLPRMLAERAEALANSPARILYSYLYYDRGWTWEASRRTAIGLANGLFALAAAGLTLWLLDFRPARWKMRPAPARGDDRVLWRGVAAVALLYLLVGSFWFQHWYVVWALAAAALLPDSALARRLLPWLGFGALAGNAVAGFVASLTSEPLSRTASAALIVAVTYAPFAACAIRELYRRRAGADETARTRPEAHASPISPAA
jgi:hypothetical protein